MKEPAFPSAPERPADYLATPPGYRLRIAQLLLGIALYGLAYLAVLTIAVG